MAEDFVLDDKHLVAAGIEVSNEDNSSQTGASTESGSSTQSGTSPHDQIQGDAGKDSVGGKPNGGAKQDDKAAKGQGAGDPQLKEGDLKLPNGEIVKAGAERRHFEQARLFKAETLDLKAQLNTANQKFGTLETRYNELKQTVSQIGMEDPSQVSSAVRLYKDLARSPVETVTKLLAELKGKGYNFDGIGGAVDTAAIQLMLENQKTSSSEQEQQGPTQEQIAADAAKEVQDFVGQFPDALIHEQMIANVIDAEAQAGREVDLRTVYFRLRQSAINNGLDWSQPLGPQIEARRAAAGGQQQQQQQQRGPAPIVQGRGGVGQPATTENIDPFKSGNGDSKDDAILAAMRENGYNYTR